MEKELRGGRVYILANRYRGPLYFGVTSDLAARIHPHRAGKGAKFAARHDIVRIIWALFIESIDLAIAHEKRLKRWRREWKFALIETVNPDCRDLFDDLAGT